MTQTLFGTDGIRGRAGEGIFTPSQLIRLGHALGAWLHEKYPSTKILIIHDTRISASLIKSALKMGLLESSIDIIDGFVAPTPAALFMMQQLDNTNIALVISASHNPYYDNGIKIIERCTGTISVEDELLISYYFHQSTRVHTGWGIDTPLHHGTEIYINALLQRFSGTWARGIRVMVDNAHGATSHIAQKLFAHCGADVINLHHTPNGYNINAHAGSTSPQTLAQLMPLSQADIGFAFDGDGDRVIAVNKEGIIKNGDDIICILASHPRYQATQGIVGTVMTNEGLATHFKGQNKKLLRTPVGTRHLSNALIENNLLIGGEPIGHIILQDQLPLGDALLNALLLLETVIITKNWNLDSFVAYPHVMTNIPIKQRFDLNEDPFTTLLQQYSQHLYSTGRILVRYSGTEDILRIMVEASTYDTARLISTQLIHELTQLFNEHSIAYSHRDTYEAIAFAK